MMKKLLLNVFLLLMMAIGAMAQTTLFSEDFEGGSMPDGWTTDGPGSWSVGSGDYSSTTGAGQGTYNAKITHGSTGSVTKLITPEIDLSSATSVELRFMHVQRSWAGDFDYLNVYYRASSDDSWTEIASYTTAYASWTTEEGIALPNLSSTYQLAFEMTDNYGYGVGVDYVQIATPPTCIKPTTLAASGITSTSATLDWSAGASETAWVLKYGPAGFDVESEGTSQNISTTPTFEITGLAANTAYDVYVKANCGGGDESEWIQTSFRTECGIESIPWSENFDSQSAGAVPTCWTKVGSGSALVNNGNANSGSNSLRFSGVTGGNIIALPQFGSEISGLQLSFYTRPENTTNSSCGTFEVGYITDLTDASTFVPVESYAYNDWASATHTQKDVVMSSAPAGSYFAFNHKANATYYYWFVDDVSVDLAPSCVKPISLAVSNVTARTATLTWTAGADETAWQICVNGDEDNLINVTEPTYTFAGLTPETNYTVKVRANCGASSQSEWTANVSFTTAVSCPLPTGLTYTDITTTSATLSWTAGGSETEWALKYGVAGFDVETEGTLVENLDAATYELTGLNANTVYGVYVKAVCGAGDESAWRSGSFRTECGLEAIPYSENFDAQTANQVPACWTKVGSGTAVAYSYSTNANSGSNYLRFSGVSGGNIIALPQFGNEISSLQLSFYTRPESATNNSCGTFEVGYITDLNDASTFVAVDSYAYNDWASATYVQKDIVMSTAPSGSYFAFNHKANSSSWYWFVDDVSVDMAPSCVKPISLAVSNITGHTATLTWTAGADETAWQISLNDDEDDLINVTEPTYTLTGLAPESDYTVKVRANCGTDGNSEWTANVAFTTTVSCPAPADFAVAALAATSATLTWTAGEAGEWVLQYGTDNTFAENTEITVDAASAELTGLTAETVYYARVKAVCGVDDESAWSSTLSFEPTAKITIGSGTATSNYLPTYNYFNYELTQQIYTAAEIGAAGTISSVDFYNAGSTKTRTLNVYLVNTDKNTFADGSDWIAVADGDLVFSGSVTFTSGRWTTITFDNDFYYDGTSNVAIVVDDNTGDYTNSPHISCRVFAAASQAIYYNNDSNNPDPTSPSAAGTLSNNKNQIRLMLTPGAPSTCTKPSSLEVSNITETGATLTWLAGADETAWQICVNGDEDNLIDVDAPTYALTGLSAASTYTVKLRSNCGNGDFSIWTTDIEFNTAICAAEDQCQLTFTLTDGYGDGWNGAAIQVTDVVTGIVIGEFSGENLDGIDDDYEETNTFTLAVCNDREIRFSWISGEYDDECSYTVTDVNGVEIFSGSDEMTSPVTYTVSCSAPATTYTITATAGENGTITPAGAVTVDEGADQAFSITPAAGYQIASVMVDTDNDVTATVVANNGIYTFTNVTADHTIAATFEVIPATTYTITATAGEHGAIDPEGAVTVTEGGEQAFVITPDTDYRIDVLTVDGEAVALNDAEILGYTYTFTDVVANHTIDVTFTSLNATDMIEAASMAIYPNPNNGMFSIDFSNIEGDATYEIIDVRGAVVETRSINVMNGATMNFNHNLDAGTYFVRIISGDKVYVEQIVVE